MGAEKIAVVLSGCGVFDGAEIHESVLTLLALTRAGVDYACFAPDMEQAHVVNHLTGEPEAGAKRNVLVEAARIARGEIRALSEWNVDEFAGVIFPGGFGAAKNLCSLAFDGGDYGIRSDVAGVLKDAHSRGKVIGVMCIAPALAAAALGEHAPSLTVGSDAGTNSALEGKGARMIEKSVRGVVVDLENKIVSTPAYMLAGNLIELESGINAFVAAFVDLLD